MKVLVCIPARYDSTRLPGKVLAKDTGKFLIQHTYEQACKARLPEKVIIATDSQKVIDAARSFGAEAVLTSTGHKSGTDRIAEAVADIDAEIVVNVQADEPEIDPANIDKAAQLLLETKNSKLKTQNYYGMATLATEFKNESQIADPNIVKVVVTSDKGQATSDAIYFSRSVIPYDRQAGGVGPVKNYLRHLGIYAYRKDFLEKFTKLPQGQLEQIEKLEQLRAIENGYSILVAKVEHTCDGVDTPEQYAEFVRRYKSAIEKKGISNFE